MMTNLKIEFDKTKSLLIGLTHHLDDIEKKFNLVESELKKRKVS